MQKFLGTVQKQIGTMNSVVGLSMVIVNFLSLIIEDGFSARVAFFNISVWLLMLLEIPFIVSMFIESYVLKMYQIAAFFFTGSVNIMQGGYRDFYGPALFLAGWLLMRHYGFLEKKGKLKNFLILVFLIAISQISAVLNAESGVYAGFSTLIYSLFLVLLLLIIWRDMVLQQQQLKSENQYLQTDYNKLTAQLKEIEEEQKPYDLKAVKITPAEERVIKILTVYKASNREIAERLNIAESTVKLHLYNIYNKIGVDSRFAIIDLCKYNF